MVKKELTINQRVDRVAELGNTILEMVNRKVATGKYEALEAMAAISTMNAVLADRTIDKADIESYIKLRLHKLYGERE